jgi:hypothetical protein
MLFRHLNHGRLIFAALLIGGAVLLLTPLAAAQPHFAEEPSRWITGVGEPLWFAPTAPKDQIEKLKARWEALKLEHGRIEKSSTAGDYGTGGETHATLLRWAPLTGYVVVHVDTCAATVRGFSYGSVIFTPTTLKLMPEAQFSQGDDHGHGNHRVKSNEFLFVKWRNVLYLTRQTDIANFLDSLAGLGKYNGNNIWDVGPEVYSSGGEESGTADDLPIVPPGFESFVRRPINLTITGVGHRIVRRFRVDYDTEPHYESRTAVTVNGGRLEGVRPGMRFHVLDSAESDEVVVRSVDAHSSRAEIIRWVEPKTTAHFSRWADYERYPRIQVGWRLTTSIHKYLDARAAAERSEPSTAN